MGLFWARFGGKARAAPSSTSFVKDLIASLPPTVTLLKYRGHWENCGPVCTVSRELVLFARLRRTTYIWRRTKSLYQESTVLRPGHFFSNCVTGKMRSDAYRLGWGEWPQWQLLRVFFVFFAVEVIGWEVYVWDFFSGWCVLVGFGLGEKFTTLLEVFHWIFRVCEVIFTKLIC